MKKILVVMLGTLLLASCGNSKKEKETEPSKTVVNTDSCARKTLEYRGLYKGIIPSASGEGIKMAVALFDSTYIKGEVFVGKETTPFEEKGRYSWDETGNIITLTPDSIKQGTSTTPEKFLVKELSLTKLDQNGKVIEGDLADKYVLKK